MNPDGLLQIPLGMNVVNLPEPMVTKLQRHAAITQPLFAREPCMQDVEQGQLGDCYVLAGINAILRQPEGAQLVQSIMKDNRDGTVTVRMYKNAGYHYVRLRKTMVKEAATRVLGVRLGSGRVLHNQRAAWVSLLEKAFLTFVRSDRGTAGNAPGYDALETGTGAEAMEAFLGPGLAKATGPRAGLDAALDAQTEASGFFTELVELSVANRALPAAARQQTLRTVGKAVFGDDVDYEALATRWLNWNTAEKRKELRAFTSADPTGEKFERLMQRLASDLDQTTRDLVVIWARGRQIWPGDVGSGIYTAGQLNEFMKIQRVLATNRSVTLVSKENIAGPVTGRGHSAGEPEVAGLVGKHVYSVLDTKVDAVGRRYVQLRNPWGSYGRSYTTQPRALGQQGAARLEPMAVQEQADSWVELTDLGRNFNPMEYGGAVEAGPRQAHMQNLAANLAAQRQKMGFRQI